LLILKHPGHNVDRMPRLNHLCRRPVRCAGWYPDYVVRLLRVGEAQFSDSLVHESLFFFGGLDGFSASLLQAVEVCFKYCKAITNVRDPII